MGLFGTKKQADYKNCIVDIHSHMIPGVDDGAKSYEQAYAMLDIAYRHGIRDIIATPHFMPDGKNATPEIINAGVDKLQAYADENHYDLNIYKGNEIYFHEEAVELLEQDKICTLADSNCVLVEFSPMDDARYIRNSLAELQNMGFQPIIAHVERYMSLISSPFDKIEELKDMGILIQVNAGSITGFFGKQSKTVAEKLLKKELVDFIGTDAHSDGGRAPRMKECVEILTKKCKPSYVEDLLYRNAETYILN
ncbi:MAG: protein-tyrosine-phosphatase [Lachnospiraceae bacterium]|nr:protein-tyrosine-phosphatase [Lachnospiraceae bacterium]